MTNFVNPYARISQLEDEIEAKDAEIARLREESLLTEELNAQKIRLEEQLAERYRRT